MKAGRLQRCLRPWLSTRALFSPAGQTRHVQKSTRSIIPRIPPPRPFVPDVQSFLTLIGRGLSRYANKFPSWESLFSLTSRELKELGIEPAASRKYLIHWLHRYRIGALGPGGDFAHVRDGMALLQVARPPPEKLSLRKFVVNVPMQEELAASATGEAGAEAAEKKDGNAITTLKAVPEAEVTGELVRPQHYVVKGQTMVVGPNARQLRDSGAIIKIREGMWEHKREPKKDGGERRQAEIRFKKRAAERRAEREAEALASL